MNIGFQDDMKLEAADPLCPSKVSGFMDYLNNPLKICKICKISEVQRYPSNL